MPTTTYLADKWTSFRAEVLRDAAPDVVPPGQLLDMQTAFYGGVAALYSILSQICDGFAEAPTAADIQKVGAIKLEIIAFTVALKLMDHKR